MRKFEGMKKVLSILLCVLMLVQYVPTTVFAVTDDNLCEHHAEHTAECGYAAAVAGADCTHVHSESCYAACTGEHEGDCTAETGCVRLEPDCHHIHGDCGYSERTAEVPCGHRHSESCGYAEAVTGTPCAYAETDPDCDHAGDCGFVAAVEGQPCGHTEHIDCGYASAIVGTPCTHVCSVDAGCYKLLCSHKDGGHDAACGYVAAVEAKPCTNECADCASKPTCTCGTAEGEAHSKDCALYEEPTCTCNAAEGEAHGENCALYEEPTCTCGAAEGEAHGEDCPLYEAPVCTCETGDPAFHATNCPAYVAPENPECFCWEKCTGDNVNVWCDVCGVQGVEACQGAGEAALDAIGDTVTVGGVDLSSATPYLPNDTQTATAYEPTDSDYAYWDAANNTLTLNNFNYTGPNNAIYSTSSDKLTIIFQGENTLNSTGNTAISAAGSLTIQGNATTITASASGIDAGSDLTIEGTIGTVTAGSGYGIRATGDVTISGKVENVTAGGYGIYAERDVTISGTVTNVEATGAGGTGISSVTGDVIISGTVKNVTVTGANGTGISSAVGDVIISGTVNKVEAESFGITAKTNLAIGGTVQNVTVTGDNGNGIYAYGNVTINGTVQNVTVPGTGGNGIYAIKNVTIESGGKVDTVTASGENGYGIYAHDGGVNIAGEVRNVTAGGNGIYAYDGDVTISGTVEGVSAGGTGIYSANRSVVLASDATVTDVKSTSPDGYAIASDQGVFNEGATISGVGRIKESGEDNVTNSYYLMVGGVTMSSFTPYLPSGENQSATSTGPSGGYAYWDADKSTLTLNSYSYTGSSPAIFSTLPDLTIIFQGENTLSSTGNDAIYVAGNLTINNVDGSNTTIESGGNGIYADQNLTISGTVNKVTAGGSGIVANGNVTIATGGKVENVTASGENGGGIVANGNVTIESGGTVQNVTASGVYGGISALFDDVTISGTVQNVTAKNGSGIYANGNVTIASGGTVDTVKAGGSGIYAAIGNVTIESGGKVENVTASGVYGGGIDANENVTIGGKVDTVKAEGGGINARSGDVTILGGAEVLSVTATGNGIAAEGEGGRVIIGGTVDGVTAEGKYGCGINAIGNVTIESGGTVQNVTAKNGNGISGVTIESGGTVKSVKVDGENFYGIYAYDGDVTISGTVEDVTASGEGGYGIYAFGNVILQSGAWLKNVTASGEGGYGIYAGQCIDIKSNATVPENIVSQHYYEDFWDNDENEHWHECPLCHSKKDNALHTGGAATCEDPAVCSVCNMPYGSTDSNNHTGQTEVRGKVDATTTSTGYTGDTYCLGCDTKIATGTTIPKKNSDGTSGTGIRDDSGDNTPTVPDDGEDTPSGTPANPPATPVTVPISGDDNTIRVNATVKGTTAIIDEIDLSRLNSVVSEHVDTGVVTIDFSVLDKKIDTVQIPADAIKHIAEAVADPDNDAESLEIILSDGTSIEFDAVALGEKVAQTKGEDITISIQSSSKVKTLTSGQKEAVGSRPAYDINVYSGGVHISDMGGTITIHAPYTLKSGEKPEGIVVWYVDDQGNRERCETSYDSVKKRVGWKTDHLSLYMIDYEEPAEETTEASVISEKPAAEGEHSAASAIPTAVNAQRGGNTWLLWISGSCLLLAAALGVYLFFLLRKPGKYQR